MRRLVKLKQDDYKSLKWTADRIFGKIGNVLSIAALTPEEYKMIGAIKKNRADLENMNSTWLHIGYADGGKAGYEEGHTSGVEQTAIGLLKLGVSLDVISQATELTVERLMEMKRTLIDKIENQ